jgi:hypothetical protein
MDTSSIVNQIGTLPFLNVGQERMEAALALQKELLESYGRASRAWLARFQTEIAIWSGLGKTVAGRSIPEVVQAYGECVSEQIKMSAEDAQRVFDDWRELTEKVTRSLGNRWAAASQSSGGH